MQTTTSTPSTPTVTIYPPEGGPFTWDAERAVYLTAAGEELPVHELDDSLREFIRDTRNSTRKLTKRAQGGKLELSAWREHVLSLMETTHKLAAATYDGGLASATKSYAGRPEIKAWLQPLVQSDREWLGSLTPDQFQAEAKSLEGDFNRRLWEGVSELPAWKRAMERLIAQLPNEVLQETMPKQKKAAVARSTAPGAILGAS